MYRRGLGDESMLSHMYVPVVLLKEGKIIEINSAFEKMQQRLKLNIEELVMKNSSDSFFQIVESEDVLYILATIRIKKYTMICAIPLVNFFRKIPLKVIIKSFQKEICDLLDCIKVGVWITDENANSLALNKQSVKTGKEVCREDLLNKNMKELIEKGYLKNSSAIKVIKNRKENRIVQVLGDGMQIYTAGVPYFYDDKLQLVMCTDLDISQATEWKKLFEEQERKMEKYEKELEYFRQKNEAVADFIFNTESMRRIVGMALRVAKVDTTILIQGESGTGKEVLADLIYQNSNRKNKTMIKVNCGAIPESLLESELFGYERGSFTGAKQQGKIGLFELAHKGTLFLDEIGEIPLNLQSKLLRAIQEREIRRIGGKESISIDIRIIAATNINLKKAVEEGRFREDLYYRLNVVPIEIPPLRRRKKDIVELVGCFVKQFNNKYRTEKVFDDSAILELSKYDWPGNIRELKNIVERVIVTTEVKIIEGEQIRYQNLDNGTFIGLTHKLEGKSLKERTEKFEKELLEIMVYQYPSANKIAESLQVNRSTITRKLKKYGITYKGFSDI